MDVHCVPRTLWFYKALNKTPPHVPLHVPRPPHWEVSSSVRRLASRKGHCLTRSTQLKNGAIVKSSMNCVSYQRHAVIGVGCLYLLTQQDFGGSNGSDDESDDGSDDGSNGGSNSGSDCGSDDEGNCMRPPHNWPMIQMLLTLVQHCSFGMVMEAKRNQKYAQLVGLEKEYVGSSWHNDYNEEYIAMNVETNYGSLTYVLKVLLDASMIPSGCGILDQVDPDLFMKGIIAMCALPDPSISTTNMFESYVHGEPDAVNDFFSEWVKPFTESVKKAWQDNGGTETNRITIGNLGMGLDRYFNMDGHFETDAVTIRLS
jgi:hypothetical protein